MFRSFRCEKTANGYVFGDGIDSRLHSAAPRLAHAEEEPQPWSDGGCTFSRTRCLSEPRGSPARRRHAKGHNLEDVSRRMPRSYALRAGSICEISSLAVQKDRKPETFHAVWTLRKDVVVPPCTPGHA